MFRSIHLAAFMIALLSGSVFAAAISTTNPQAANYMDTNSYDYMYPYMNNKMRVGLSSGEMPAQSQNSIAALVKTSDVSPNKRRVVARGATNIGRVATTAAVAPTIARSGITTGTGAFQGTNSAAPMRRVIARGNNTTVRSARGDESYYANAAANSEAAASTTATISSDRCLADYTQCMNGYCQRNDAAYNRCYCSSRLAQIDAEYQPAIDSLIKQIIVIKEGAGTYTQEEMEEYWADMIVKHTGDNSWTNLDNALDINWADTESRVRGTQAFVTGHEYCAQHLRGCYYMAANMRDAYRSDIARDCAAYEASLQNVKTIAESVVDNYSE